MDHSSAHRVCADRRQANLPSGLPQVGKLFQVAVPLVAVVEHRGLKRKHREPAALRKAIRRGLVCLSTRWSDPARPRCECSLAAPMFVSENRINLRQG